MSGIAGVPDSPTQTAWRTLVRGVRLTPEFARGLPGTVAWGALSTAGRLVVPVAVQLTIDRGLLAAGGPDVRVAVRYSLVALAAVLLTAGASYVTSVRLVRATEHALSNLRVQTFRHIHDLSVLHHTTEHRGALVSRVTADVDTISEFMRWGGIFIIVGGGQIVLAAAVMAIYNWALTLEVIALTLGLAVVMYTFQRRLIAAYDHVRERVGRLLGVIGEVVAGAAVVRAYAIEDRTEERVGEAVEDHFRAAFRAGRLSAIMFSSGELFAGMTTALVLVLGLALGVGRGLTAGQLVAFLFLVTLFVTPVQEATELGDHMQSAISGWRRILAVLDTPADVADPGESGHDLPAGPIGIRFQRVTFRYPTGPPALRHVDLEIAPTSRVAVVGETGSGKTTFAKLLTRLVDPTQGRVLLNGVPLDQVRFSSLRRRVVLLPQDGFLFDTSVDVNVRYGRPGATRDDVELAFVELGLSDWVASLPRGLDTRAGERGSYLSVGERQFVALARAWVAAPDLLVLDEATSAVDPANEARVQRALEGLTRGRTAIAIAHRLSTAEQADEVLVFDDGSLVERGGHRALVRMGGVYAGLHASWRERGRA